MSRAKSLYVAALGISAVMLLAPAAGQAPQTHQHSFGDAEKWSKVFDDPERDAWQKPHEVIRALALKPDTVIADIGAGTGYFAVRFAHNVPQGRVYAVDIEPDMVRHLAERAKKAGLGNLQAITGTPRDPRLPGPVDWIVLVDAYHHIGGRERYFRELRKSIKPGGRLAVIDFRLDSPVGPPQRARITPDTVKSELKRAGYALEREHGFLPNQYFLVFQPARS